jgi:energy-coupling factor transporter ATP-binding protein EcfA2
LQELGLAGLSERAISSLSFGERKRLAVATALVVRPHVLLCDEPTMGLDPQATALVIRAVDKLTKGSGMTVVWATHDRSQLPQQARQGCLLRQGQIVAKGALSEVLAHVI